MTPHDLRDHVAERTATLARTRSVDSLVRVAQYAIRVATNLSPVPSRLVQCAAGCSWCCYQRFGATVPECVNIAEAIRDHEHADVFWRHLRAVSEARRRYPDSEWRQQNVPCGLLNAAGSCAVYRVRALICRGHTSHDAAGCRALNEGADGGTPGDWQRGEIHIAAAGGILRGLEVAGLRPDLVELSSGVLVALDRAAVAEWMAGADAFSEARIANVQTRENPDTR